MKKTLIITLSLLLFSCKKETKIINIENIHPKIENLAVLDTLERFSDSTNFGIKNKIDIYRIGTNHNTFIKIYLYEKNINYCEIKDSLTIEGTRINDLKVEVNDFNNDNIKDILFTSGMAARGGNNVQTLILYSPKNKSLNWIKNSENFPNLMYNEKLDCIDACILTGGQTTYFLKIKNDSLKEFANVDQRDGRIITEILDKNGKWKEIENIKDEPESFDRFINFNPIEKRK
ncbi:hypothetical protein [Flavobacterium sp. 5]|uniref:hypothetical protein n=1 Tax=Flavobacterium sp. 5 TaxID=2035199 RepID=UPI000C2C0B98|nr:hypothetical protein [Flavobacterium sp. 5]PKB17299.1 hypothetical protein CLU82_2496 [Flavobacterium sp. 5]